MDCFVILPRNDTYIDSILHFFSSSAMKSIIMFIVGIIIGLVLGLKFGYEAVINTAISESQNVVNTVLSQGVGSGSQALLDTYQSQATQLIEEQKNALKQEAKQQLTDYLTNKVDELF